jgi:hypothetical protein
MEKKVYIRPIVREVKIKVNRLLVGSPEVQIHNEKSDYESY